MEKSLPMMETLTKLPTPSSISYLWNMGSLLGMTLTLQIITGLLLSMSFISETNMAFQSVIHTMRDINTGWISRTLHMNGASLFFMMMYIHIMRGIYFNSPKTSPKTWNSGIIILLLSMMTAFLGYVLPWGQMSFWGATVITSMISAIPMMGKEMTQWVWGNFSVSQPTLNRFLSLHFILPFAISLVIIFHLILLHQKGSSNPTSTQPNLDKTKFYPSFFIKDLNPVSSITIILLTTLSIHPFILGDVENFNPASPTSTPNHIQPEWYFLFAYSILRAIPSKLGGVITMIMAILMLSILTMKPTKMNKKFNPMKKMTMTTFVSSCCILTWIGANPAEYPFTYLSTIMTITYFTTLTML